VSMKFAACGVDACGAIPWASRVVVGAPESALGERARPVQRLADLGGRQGCRASSRWETSHVSFNEYQQ
jgi:hypothetical protein